MLGRKMLLPLGLFVLAGCASQGDLINAQRDMDETKSRVLRIEKQLSSVEEQTRSGIEKSVKGVHDDIDSLRKNQADLGASLDGVKVDLQVVGGKLDDALNSSKKPAEDLALLREDTDRRLASVEQRIAQLGRELEELRKKMETKAAESPATPEARYQAGQQAVASGETAKGREILQKFLADNPKHDLAANARYWIGESYYQEKKYEQAILEFQDMIKDFPAKEKTAAALLKQGMAFAELGDHKSSRYVLRKVIADFPLSDEAKKAQEKLAAMK